MTRVPSIPTLASVPVIGRGAAPPFSPAELFANGEQGVWFDPSDLDSMFQDAAGTTPAAYGQPVGLIRDKSGNGNHASQATATARPTLGRMPVGGRRNLLTHTEDFGNAVWTKQLAAVVGIEGNQKLIETASYGQHHFYSASVNAKAGEVWTAYADVTAAERTQCFVSLAGAGKRRGAYFDLVAATHSADSGVTASMQPLGGGRYRCVITLAVAIDTTSFFGVFTAENNSRLTTGTGSEGIYVHKVQLELSSTATPYQRVGASRYDVTEDGAQSLSYLYRDPVDDALPWTAPAGSYDIVHIPLTGPATVLTEQALSGATNILLADNTRAYLAIDRRLTATEIDALTAYYGASA